jgi:hypothetical protein
MKLVHNKHGLYRVFVKEVKVGCVWYQHFENAWANSFYLVMNRKVFRTKERAATHLVNIYREN